MGISLGLVGLGSFGKEFAPLFKSHPLVDRIALCDREPERMQALAEKESWKDKLSPRDLYPSLDDICKSDLDALVIITQHWLHAPQCVQAMQAGKHVYSAVPVICIPDGDEILDWCDKLVQTSSKTGMSYMLGETTIYRPESMYCRRQAKQGGFGQFTYSEGEYFHDVDDPGCNLRYVIKSRLNSKAGQEWQAVAKKYTQRGLKDSPMFYPTHSISGPLGVMNARAVKVSAWGMPDATNDEYFSQTEFTNETALFHLDNGSTMRIIESRKTGVRGRETFRLYGTKGAFEDAGFESHAGRQELTVDQMRDPLPAEVLGAYQKEMPEAGNNVYGAHGGSHAYLVHEFISAVAERRQPAISVRDAAHWMAAGVMAHKSAQKDGETLQVPNWDNAK